MDVWTSRKPVDEKGGLATQGLCRESLIRSKNLFIYTLIDNKPKSILVGDNNIPIIYDKVLSQVQDPMLIIGLCC